MEMDNSLRNSMMQLIQMQAQSVNAINQLTNTMSANNANAGISTPNPAALTSYTNYAGSAASAPPNPFSPSPQASARFGMYASQITPGGFKDTAKSFIDMQSGAKMSPEQAQLIGAQRGANAGNAAIAGGGAIASGLGSFAGYAMVPGMVAGTAAGAVGGVGGGAVASVMLDQAKQAQSYNQFMIQNSYKFINPLESNNNRSVGGFAREERWSAASMLRRVDSEMNISDKDTMDILKGVTDAGLMKSATDMKSFEKKFKQLVSTTKEMAISLNASFKESIEFMGEMQKRGVSEGNFDYFAAAGKVTGSMIGKSSQEATALAMGMASGITSGTGMNYETTLAGSNFSLAIYEKINEEAKKKAKGGDQEAINVKNLIGNLGGADKAAGIAYQTTNSVVGSHLMTSQALVLGYDPKTGKIDQDVVMKAVKGKDMDQISDMIQKKAALIGDENMYNFTKHGVENASQVSAENQSLLMGIMANAYYKTGGLDMKTSTADKFQTTFGLTAEQALLAAQGTDYQNNNPQFKAQLREAGAKQEAMSKYMANDTGALTGLINIGKGAANVLGDLGQGITKGFSNSGEDIMAWANGGSTKDWNFTGASYDKKSVSAILRGVGTDNIMNAQESDSKDKSLAALKRKAKWESAFAKGKDKSEYAEAIQTYDKIITDMEGFSDAGSIIAKAAGSKDKNAKSFLSKLGYGNAKWSGRSLSEAGDMYDAGEASLEKIIKSVDGKGKSAQTEFLSKLILTDEERTKYSNMFSNGSSAKKITTSLLKDMNTTGSNGGDANDEISKNVEDSSSNIKKMAKAHKEQTDATLEAFNMTQADLRRVEMKVAKMGGSGFGIKGIGATSYGGKG